MIRLASGPDASGPDPMGRGTLHIDMSLGDLIALMRDVRSAQRVWKEEIPEHGLLRETLEGWIEDTDSNLKELTAIFDEIVPQAQEDEA